MARKDDLKEFSKEKNIPNGVIISDNSWVSLSKWEVITRIDEREIEFFGVDVRKIEYKDHLGRVHTVIAFYKIHEIENVKFHNIGLDIEFLLDKKRFKSTKKAIEYLKINGGLLIFLDTKSISKEQVKEFVIGREI